MFCFAFFENGSLFFLLVLVVSSITALRRRIWPDYRRFKSLHAWLAIACAVLAGWHLAGSHFYLNTNFKLAVAGTVAIALLGGLVWRATRSIAAAIGAQLLLLETQHTQVRCWSAVANGIIGQHR